MKNKLIAMILSLCMVMTMVPMTAMAESAEDADGLAVVVDGNVYTNGASIYVDKEGIFEEGFEEALISTSMSEVIIYAGASTDSETDIVSSIVIEGKVELGGIKVGNADQVNATIDETNIYTYGEVSINDVSLDENTTLMNWGDLSVVNYNGENATLGYIYGGSMTGFGEAKIDLYYDIDLADYEESKLDISYEADHPVLSTTSASEVKLEVAEAGYVLPETIDVVQLNTSGAEDWVDVAHKDYTYDSKTGLVKIWNIAGNIVIDAKAVKKSETEKEEQKEEQKKEEQKVEQKEEQKVEQPVYVAKKVVVGAVQVKTDTKGNAKTVAVPKKNQKKKSITVKATVKIDGVTYDVTTIGANTFKNCKKVTKITLPASITKVEKNAFKGAKKLKVIKFNNKKPAKIVKGAFKGLNTKKMTIQVNKKMTKKNFKAFQKALKKAGFKGKIVKK